MALYGITHSLTGKPLVRLAKTLKVGIGYPKGPAIHVYIDHQGLWTVETGSGKDTKRQKYNTRGEAQGAYAVGRKTAPERKFPAKFGYFTFQRVAIDGSFAPDWDAIELHGPMPNEIGIVFLDNAPLHQQMEWWTAAELKCSGDGRDGSRRITAAQGKDEQAAAAMAGRDGSQFFPIHGGCFAMGCKYARGEKPVCKPHTRLSFQLVNAPALGSTVVFDSTGFRSASQLFSSLEQIRTITGRGNPDNGVVAGIPLILKLLPYKTSHNGQPSTQFGVTLHLKAKDAMSLTRTAIGQADEFRQLAAPALMIEAAVREETETVEVVELAGEVLAESAEAAAMAAEFYAESGEEEVVPAEDYEFEDAPTASAPEPPKPTALRRKSEQSAASPVKPSLAKSAEQVEAEVANFMREDDAPALATDKPGQGTLLPGKSDW